MNSFVELSRRFRDLTESELDEPELLMSLGESEFYSSFGWEELLDHPRVLLLAEAGSGKTREMHEQARRLVAENKYGFFIPLESLDRDNLAALLSGNEERPFAAWKADGHSTAWFFLDAVDELKLTQGTFERALTRFAKAVDGLLHRVRVVISGRPTDWRPSLDMATLEEKLPIVRPETIGHTGSEEAFMEALRKTSGLRQREEDTVDAKGIRPVVLLPLSRRQIEVFSGSLGVTDTTDFVAELDRQDAWIFARCPLDCADLAAIWKSSGKLGTRAEQHEANIAVRLKDDPEREDRGVLSDTGARSGAERLALALALTRRRTFRAPERRLDLGQADSVLEPSEALPDWDEDERQTLLRRGLFDPATYGRVRFHHRSVQEYLAACRLNNLRDKGMPIKSLLRLLFSERYGVAVVIPSMRPIVAWLGLWDEVVRREVMAREPETLLTQGDPESLPVPARAALVRAFAAAYGEGGWRGLNVPIAEVRRLGHPELADVIRELWGDGPINDDVRELLLELIWQGKISKCADIAEEAAKNAEYGPDDRVIGIRGLVACNCVQAAHAIALSILAEPGAWPDRVVRSVAGDLFPNIITADELMELVERTPESPSSVGDFSWTLREVAATIDALSDSALRLRDRITDLIWQGRAEDQEAYQIQGRYNHLAPALAILCDRQLSTATSKPNSSLVRACVVANRFGREEIGSEEIFVKLKDHFRHCSPMRSEVFWMELTVMDKLVPDNDDRFRFYHAEHHSLVEPLAKDHDHSWLEKALGDTSAPKHRRIAFHALAQLWAQGGQHENELDSLYRAVQDDPELTERMSKLAAPVEPTPEQRKLQNDLLRQNHNQERRAEQRLENWKKWRSEILADPSAAFSGDSVEITLSNLYKWLMAYEGTRSHYNLWNYDALAEAFGSDLAGRAKTAFESVWRVNKPMLWSQRSPEERDSTPWKWIYGLCGIAAEATSTKWAIELSSEEARTAAAYASIELNGFPPWLSALVDAHPDEVSEVLGTELTEELGASTIHQHLPLLQHLTHADIKVKQLLVERCLAALKEWPTTFPEEDSQRHSSHHLDQVFRILYDATTNQHKEIIASECKKRFESNPQGPLSLSWLRGLFQGDAHTGARVLQYSLAEQDESAKANRAVDLFARLFADRNNDWLPTNPLVRAETLDILIRCVYNYIRPEDDRQHEGAYTPDTRDKAENARNFLLSALVNTPGADAHRIITAFADDPLFSHFPDRLRLMARERAATDAEFKPFAATDVAQIEARLEVPPHDRDGLFQVMKDRLDDLSHDIAHDDFSDRITLCGISRENEMQRTIARRLRDTAKGAYVVAREEEVVDRKETDIRLRAVQGDEKAVIEIKIADKRWSLRDLETGLREQLVGQYMRHNSSRVGCLLLTYDGTKQYWMRPETNTRLYFNEMINYLDAVATEIERVHQHKIRLAVHTLDLTDPSAGSIHE